MFNKKMKYMEPEIVLLKKKIVLTLILFACCWGVSAQLICIRPVITIQPVSNTACVGNISLFTVVSLGTNLSYQWQVNNGTGFVNCVNGGVYSGALTATLSVTGAASLNGGQYRCVVSNSCGTAISNLCLLNILSPNVTASASPAAICPGASSTLTASGANTYKWSTGQTGSTITVTPSSTTTYSVKGTNSLGCSKTATVTVTVNPLPNVTASASPSAICKGASSTLTASDATSYQWST